MNRRTIDVIENAVSVPNVLQDHRIRFHGKRCKCPIHHGQRNSFSFTDKVWHCFTCGESGGVIQLEAQLSGTTLDEACHALASRYGLEIDRPFTKEDKRNYKLDCMVARDYDEWEQQKKKYYMRLSNLYRNIKDIPELSDISEDLEEWLDENIEGVKQEWTYQSSAKKITLTVQHLTSM